MGERAKGISSLKSKNSFFDDESMFVYDIDSLFILDANGYAVSRYGYSKKELVRLKMTDLGKRVSFSELDISAGAEFDKDPKELWRHESKDGDSWVVQITTQQFRHNGTPVKLAIIHDVDHLLEKRPPKHIHFPRIDLVRTKMPFGLIEWNSELEIRDFSEKAEQIFGIQYEDVIGRHASELSIITVDLQTQLCEKLNHTDHSLDTYFTLESEFTDQKGSDLFYLWHNSIIKDSNGKALSIYSLVEDITEKRQSKRELKKSEEKFRVISEQSFAGIYVLKKGALVYVNPRLCEITGYSENEFLKELSLKDLIHPDDFGPLNRHRKHWERNTSESFEISFRVFSKTGEVIHLKTYGSRIEKAGGKALLGVIVDQTGQVKSMDDFRSSVQSYQSLFDSISDCIYIQSVEGTFLEVNKGFEAMYGYKKEEIIGHDPSFFAATEKVDFEETKRLFNLALKGETQIFRWWGKRKNGDVFPKEIKLSKGEFFGQDVVIAVARDITGSVRREEELLRNEELFEQLFRNSPLGIAMLDKNSRILLVNNSFEELFGHKESRIKGEDLDALIVPEGGLEQARSFSNSKKTFTFTTQRKTKTGDLIDVNIYGVPVVLDGETIATYGIYMDVTEQIQAENSVRQSLEEKEVLLAEIHHRVKNNLAVITGLLELQYNNLKNEEAKSALRDSQMRINSMALIHEKLYQNETLSNIDFGVYIEELVNVIVKTHISCDSDISVDIQTVPVDLPITKAIPCGLVINEIVTNSLKYAFTEEIKEPVISLSLLKEDNRAVINISDNGVGLPKPFEEIGSNSLGTLLIKTLTSQLDADLNVNGSNGTSYKISFVLNG